jgi:type II secretory pathway component PulF
VPNRAGLFVLYFTLIALLVFTGSITAKHEEAFESLPGGTEALPGFTRVVYGLLDWMSGWGGWLLLALGIGVFVGLPKALERSEPGKARLAAFDRVLAQYYGLVLAVAIAFLFSVYWAVALATHLPYLQIMDSLSGG